MRYNIGTYFICAPVILGMVACQQQQQQQQQLEMAETVTPVVKPVVKPKPATTTKVKPAAKPRPKAKPAAKPAAQQLVPSTPKVDVPVVGAPKRLSPLGKKVFSVPMKGKYVALTFDDGPHPSLTCKAVDILNRHGAKGTFFMLGQNVARYKSIVASVAASGHELGVHTWTHIKMNSSARAKVDSEISRTQNLIGSISGTYPRVMRPPYGATNKTLVDHMYNRYGMASIMWDVDTNDWRKPGAAKVINEAVNNARPGSIILVHDIHASTIGALEGIVTGLQARGFKLVTVSELMKIGKQEAAAEAAAKAAEEAAAKAAAEAAAEAAQQPALEPAVGMPPAEEAPAEPEASALEDAQTTQPAAPEAPLNLENFILN